MVPTTLALPVNSRILPSGRYQLFSLYRHTHFSSFPAGTDSLYCTGTFVWNRFKWYHVCLLYRRTYRTCFPDGIIHLYCADNFTSPAFRMVPTVTTIPTNLSGSVLNGNLSACSTGKLTRLPFRPVTTTPTVPANSLFFLSGRYRLPLLYRQIHFSSFPSGTDYLYCTGIFVWNRFEW